MANLDFSAFADPIPPVPRLNPRRAAPTALDFSSAADPVDTTALDFSGAADPVETGVSDYVVEGAKGIVRGGAGLVGTALQGAAADYAAIRQYATDLDRTTLDLMDRVDAGEKLPPYLDPGPNPWTRYADMSADERGAYRRRVEDRIRAYIPTDIAAHPLYKAGEAITEAGTRAAPVTPGWEGSLTTTLTEGIGSMTGGVLATILGGPVAAGGMFTTAGSGEAAQRAIAYDKAEKAAGRAGLTPQQISTAGFLGIVPGATDILPIEVLLSGLKVPAPFRRPLASAIARIGGQAFIEGLQEGGQQYLQNLIAAETYNPDQKLTEGIGPNAAAGAGVGAIAEGLVEAFMPGRAHGGRAAAPDVAETATPPATEAITTPETVPEGAVPVETLYPAPAADETLPPAEVTIPEVVVTPDQQEAPTAPAEAPPVGAAAADAEAQVADYRTTLEEHGVTGVALDKLVEAYRQSLSGAPAAAGTTEAPAAPVQPAGEAVITGPVPPATRDEPAAVTTGDDLASATANPRPAPTDAQIEAGNYAKHHLTVQGIPISVENPKGSVRSGVDANGKPWSVEMPAAYGYVKRTTGRDGDQVDVYVGEAPSADKVYVVDQTDADTGKFDEHKVMLGFPDRATAVQTYRSAFSDGKGGKRIGAVTDMTIDEFKRWLREGDMKKPVAGTLAPGKPATRGPATTKAMSTAPQERGGLVSRKPAAAVKPPAVRAVSLVQFLKSLGGIREDRGVLRAMDLHRRFPGLVNNRRVTEVGKRPGLPLDRARELAAEAGYFDHIYGTPAKAMAESTPSDLIELLGQGNTAYPAGDRETLVARDRAAAEAGARDEAEHAVRSAMQDHGLDMTDTEVIARATDMLLSGTETDASDAIERAMIGLVSDELTVEEKGPNDAGTVLRTEGEADAGGRAGRGRPAVATRQAESEAGHGAEGAGEAPAAARKAEGEETLGSTVPRKPAEEPGAEGKPQTVIPGAERVSEADLAKRKAAEPLKPKVAQKPADEGLFGDSKDQRTLLSTIPRAPVFYSAALRAAEAAKITKGTPEQWLATIRNTPGVKQDEIAWLGLEDWLKTRTGAVSREQVADFIRANQIEVRDVLHGGIVPPSARTALEAWAAKELTDETDADAFENAIDDAMLGNAGGIGDLEALGAPGDLLQPIYDAINEGATRHPTYQLPGGENYRELLLTLPPKANAELTALPEGYEVGIDQSQPPERQYHILPPGQAHARPFAGRHFTPEAAIREALDRLNRANDTGTNYRSGHFDEPNILAHVRFNDRTDAAGKRTLFIEEIQSDWHQAGRKEGYRPKDWENLSNQAEEIRGDVILALKEGNHEKANALEEELNNIYNKLNQMGSRSVPDAPFKTTWPELALKRMIRWAAENDYDQVAWTPGDVQNVRYESALRQRVSEIRWDGIPGTTDRSVTVYNLAGKYAMSLTVDERGVVREATESRANGETLESLVGKEIATQIMEKPEGSVSGDNLVIGGEGMRGFYDRMLVNTANKLGKKFDARVGTTNFGDPPNWQIEERPNGSFAAVASNRDLRMSGFPTRATAEDWVATEGGKTGERERFPAHALPITPAMRESVMQGQPLFRREPIGIDAVPPGSQIGRVHAGITPKARRILEARLRNRVAKIAGLDVKVVTFDTLPAEGAGSAAYREGMSRFAEKSGASLSETAGGSATMHPDGTAIIRLALDDPQFDPGASAYHEAYHRVESQLMTDAEFRAVNSAENMAKMRRATAVELRLSDATVADLPGYEVRAVAFERYARFRDQGRPLSGLTLPAPVLRLFEKIGRVLAAAKKVLTGLGYTRFEDIFEDVYQGRMAGREPGFRSLTEPETLGSVIPHNNETHPLAPDGAEARRRAMTSGFGLQPVDRVIRIPFQIFGGLNEKGEWNPGLYLWEKSKGAATGALIGGGIGSAVAGPPGAVVGGAVGGAAGILMNTKLSDSGRFAWVNPILERARAGLIDRYGLDDAYVERDRQRGLDEARIMGEVPEMMAMFRDRNIAGPEAKVLHAILTGERTTDADWEAVSEPIRAAVDQMGQEAVELGLVSAEAVERNRGAYLHRVYFKHETDQSGFARWASQMMTSRRKKIVGEQFKGRGLWQQVSPKKLGLTEPPAAGGKYRILDRMESGDGTMADMTRTVERVYLRAGQAVPQKYAGWADRGLWEVRGTKQGDVVLWRDFTAEERSRMGEIVDARYTIAKTWMLMAHDLATGRFYRDIAKNADWATETEPRAGTWKDSAEYRRFWADPTVDWVKVPDTIIQKSRTKRWGDLAGKWVRSEIWRDLNELEQMQHSGLWKALLTQWKLNKTARNPVVHLNNVMSNLVLMDLADVRSSDLAKAVRSLVRRDEFYREAVDNGAFGSDMVSIEIRRNVLAPVLAEIEAEMRAGPDGFAKRARLVTKVAQAIWGGVKAADRKMVDLYRMEDEVFRMATYLRRRGQGAAARDAAIEAKDQFLDYDIRAPWVNAARRSVLPFISYTYRAVPLVAKAIATRPWKLAKYYALAQAANALAYAVFPGDEDRERRSMREQEQGYTWIGAPRMLRLPWGDQWGNPLFLDVRRWIPAGDVFDLNQGNGPFPIPAPLQFGGPLMMGAELLLNKQAFTGKEIVNNLTDDWWDKAAKIGDWAWKSWMPSAAWVPGSWYWEKIGNAMSGARDWLGKPYDVPQAVASSFGVKVQPADVEANFESRAFEFDQIERDLKMQLARLGKDRARGMLTQRQYERERDRVIDKLKVLTERRKAVFVGAGSE